MGPCSHGFCPAGCRQLWVPKGQSFRSGALPLDDPTQDMVAAPNGHSPAMPSCPSHRYSGDSSPSRKCLGGIQATCLPCLLVLNNSVHSIFADGNQQWETAQRPPTGGWTRRVLTWGHGMPACSQRKDLLAHTGLQLQVPIRGTEDRIQGSLAVRSPQAGHSSGRGCSPDVRVLALLPPTLPGTASRQSSEQPRRFPCHCSLLRRPDPREPWHW